MNAELHGNTLRDVAASWHQRINQEKVSEETRTAFARWLAESPHHTTTYDSVESAWRMLQSAAREPEMLALRHETALRLNRRTSHSVRPLRWGLAATVVLALSLAAINWSAVPNGRTLLSWSHGGLHSAGQRHFHTATGERLTASLEDGSQVTLDTQSELQVAFTAGQRTVNLAHGQAFFDVAKDAKRPFVVVAHDRRVIAVGTAFDVRVEGEHLQVTMVEGTVRIEPIATPKIDHREWAGQLAKISLTAGEQWTVDAAREERVRHADPDRSTAWRRGQLIFDNVRLADAIAELNRYDDTKIELGSAALGELKLSGGFATGRPNVFIEAITTYFPIRIAHADERVILLSEKIN